MIQTSKYTILYLAAGIGKRLNNGTTMPKACTHICGRPIIEWLVKCANCCGSFRQVVLTSPYGIGYKWPVSEVINVGVTGNMLETLFSIPCPSSAWTIVSYADIVYEPRVLEALLAHNGAFSVVVDTKWYSYYELRSSDPIAISESLDYKSGYITSIGRPLRDNETPHAQYIGLLKISREKLLAARAVYDQMLEQSSSNIRSNYPDIHQAFLTDFIQELIYLDWPIEPCEITGGWMEIDTPKDLALANTIVNGDVKCIFDKEFMMLQDGWER